MHVKPAERKPVAEQTPTVAEYPVDHPEHKYQNEHQQEAEPRSSNYKRQKEQILKTNFDDETNWNYLFMNQDAVATHMAK